MSKTLTISIDAEDLYRQLKELMRHDPEFRAFIGKMVIEYLFGIFGRKPGR